MEPFHFINETEGISGRVRSSKARKVIRSVVMKRHWAVDSINTPSKKNTQPKSQKTGPKELKILPAASKLNNNKPKDRENVQAPAPSFHLNRVTDVFVYGGLSIDEQSLKYFSNHGVELYMGLYNPIRPISGTLTDACCSSAIHENSKALFHTLCYQGAMYEAVIQDRNRREIIPLRIDNNNPAYKRGIMHKIAAISTLKETISEKQRISEATVRCVGLLMLGAAISGFLPIELQAHREGLKRVIKAFGGFEAASPSLVGFLQVTDVKSSIYGKTTPICSLPSWLSRQFSLYSQAPPARLRASFSRRGASFSDTKLATRISPRLYECIFYTQHLVFVVEDYYTRRNLVGLYNLDDFSTLEHVLLCLPASSEWLGGPLNECLRLSLLIYSNTTLYKTPPYFGWMTVLLSELKIALLLLDWDAIVRDSPGLLMWMLILGANLCSEKKTRTNWWGSRMFALAKKMQIQTFEEAVWTLEGFLYIERIDSRAWMGIWNDMMEFADDDLQVV